MRNRHKRTSPGVRFVREVRRDMPLGAALIYDRIPAPSTQQPFAVSIEAGQMHGFTVAQSPRHGEVVRVDYAWSHAPNFLINRFCLP